MNADVLQIAALSLRVALVATLVACALGIPAGIWLGSTVFAGRRALLTGLNTALALPTVVVGLAIYLLLSRHGPPCPRGLPTWIIIVTIGTVIFGNGINDPAWICMSFAYGLPSLVNRYPV